jgi:hypothetical protein
VEQRSSHLARVSLKRSTADRKIAHVCLTGGVRDVVIQAIGALDLVTDEVTQPALVSRIRMRSRLVVIDASAMKLEKVCRRLRATKNGWSLAIALVGHNLSDRNASARLCQRVNADVGLPQAAPRALFQEQLERALVERAPLVDFDVLPNAVATEMDTLFGAMSLGSYYDVFGIPTSATGPDIRERFHRLAELCHPDRFRNLLESNPFVHQRVEKIYKRLSEAYHVLEDPVKRAVYDLCLRTMGTLRYDPETLRPSARRELSICDTVEGRLAVTHSLAARSVGDWWRAESALKTALESEPQNGALRALLTSVSSVRAIADHGRRKTST